MRFHGVAPHALPGAPAGRSGGPRLGPWTWVRRALGAVVALLALAVLGLLVVVHCLDQPWVKHRVQALARASAGVELDYRSVRLTVLSGATIEGLVVLSPEEFRGLARELAVVDRVDARWSLASLLGHGPTLTSLALSGVTVTVVVDERGRTSFDALSQPGASADKSPAVPLSRAPAAWLGSAPAVGDLSVDRVTLVLVRAEGGQPVERTELRGLSAAWVATPAAKGWRVQARLGSPETPLTLDVERQRRGAPAGGARASLWLTVDATSTALTAAIDLHVLEQSLAAELPGDDRLHAEANARFDATAGRTAITLDHTDLAAGAATIEASIEVPDSGDPIVRHARGDVDLARLLLWVPAGLVPVTAESAHVHYQIDSLVAGPFVRLADGGAVALDADVSSVTVKLAAGVLEVRAGKLSLHGQPAPGGGVTGKGAIELSGMRLTGPGGGLGADGVALDFDGAQSAEGVVDGRAGLRFARIETAGASSIAGRDGQLEVVVQGLRPDAAEPLGTRGDVTLSGSLTSLDAHRPGGRTWVDGLTLHAHTLLEGHAPYAAEIEGKAARLHVSGAGERRLVDDPAGLQIALHDVVPDLEHPMSSRGIGRITVDLGELRASCDVTKEADAVSLALDAAAPSLKPLVPLLPPDLATAAPWGEMAVTIKTSGRADHLAGGDPQLQQSTAAVVLRPAFGTVAAQSLSLDLRSNGTALRHAADADLRVQALAVDGGDPSDDRLTLSATLDRERPSCSLRIETAGRASSKVSASLSFDRPRRAVAYQIEGTLAGLAPLAPFASKVRALEGFDLSKLELGLSARGAVLGLVSSVSRDGAIGLEPHPSRTAAVEGTVDVRVAHLRWARGNAALVTPAAAWHADMHVAGGRRTMSSHVDVDALHLGVGRDEVDLAGITDEASATVTGDLTDPEGELTVRAAVRDVHQDAVPEYPVGDLAFTLSAERDPEGLVHVSELKLVNGAGGTSLALTGSADLGARRRRLSVTTHLTQDLAPLSRAPERFVGRGTVALDATVESPDLALFRARVDLKVDDVHAKLPRAGIDVEAANGVIPITTAVEIETDDTGKTVALLRRDAERNPYSMLRFADQHSLLRRTGFISIASVSTPLFSIAPLAGNLGVEQNVVSLSQFEMGIRGGRITGQCALDWDGPRSTLELHVRASGVQSSHGEPFDGNIAVAIAAGDRTVEGRAEILHIGPRHLLDLLDMQDPMRVDPAMNRVRSALSFGYPKRLRLVFDHGFASARLELGGLASLVSLGELRGIPMGPFVDKLLGPVFDTKGAP
jgi:translocation and assembly module TamB